MELHDLNMFEALCSARDDAFNMSCNLDLSRDERDSFFSKSEELAVIVNQIAERKVMEALTHLAADGKISDLVSEVKSVSKDLDWSKGKISSTNNNLNCLSKLITSGQKLLDLFHAR